MAKIINLNKARKQKAREEAKRQAEENRVRFGRSKAQKQLDRSLAEEAERRMALLQREPVASEPVEPEPDQPEPAHPGSERGIEAWAERARQRWPNVPDLYGWLALDRRGQWLIRGEPITRPQIIDTINRNYAADARGRWYFQNGPQRGYMRLHATPLILHADGQGRLCAHTGEVVDAPLAAYLDEDGAILIDTGSGAGLLDGAELWWALERLRSPDGGVADESGLERALALGSGEDTGLVLELAGHELSLWRLDQALAPAALGFVRDPCPDN